MDPRRRSVLAAALELSETDRAFVARELLATLSPEPGLETDDALSAELSRRLEDVRNDPGATAPWSSLRDERSSRG